MTAIDRASGRSGASRTAAPRPARPRWAAFVLAAGLCLGHVAPAPAQTGPTVTVGSSMPDIAGGNLTLSDVKIVYPGKDGTTIGITKIVVRKLGSTGDAFTADAVDLDGLSVNYQAGAANSLAVAKATLEGVSAPMPTADKLTATGSPGSLPPLASWLLAAKVKAIKIPSMTLRMTLEGVATDTVYTDTVLEGIDAGKIASMAVASAKQDTAGATPELNSSLTTGKLSVEGLDLGVYAAWLDDTLAASAPKGMRPVYTAFSAEKLSMKSDKTVMEMGRISGTEVRLGAPTMKPSELMTLLGRMAADPKFGEKNPAETVTFIRAVLGAFEFGSIEVADLNVAEPGKPPVAIGLVRVENFAGARIGEIRLGDMNVTDDRDGTMVKIGSFAIRGFEVADLDPILDKVARGETPDSMPLEQYPKPRITGVALADVDVVVPGKGSFTIGGLTVDTPDWVGFAPITLKARVEGFSMPVDAIDDAEAKAGFKELGLSSLTVNSALDLAWKEADQTMALGPITLDIDGIGKAEIAGNLGGVPKSVFENPETAQAALVTLDFRGVTLTLQDGGAFAKLVAKAAEREGTTPDKLAEQAAQQIQGGMIASLGMEDAAKKVGTAVRSFITNPRSLKVAVGTLEPIPALVFMQVGNGDQASLDLVKKSIQIDASANE